MRNLKISLVEADKNALVVIGITLVTLLIAQVSKFVILLIRGKKIRECFKVLISTGGMPSSHSALVTSLAVSIFLAIGGFSYYFAIALVLALVVTHDAMGIRLQSSIHAKNINEIVNRINDMDGKENNDRKLKESLGHKPIEVLSGVILGILTAIIGALIFF